MVKNPPANAGDIRDSGSIPGSGRSPGGGHGSPFQDSCLENPMDGGAQQATIHRGHKESDTTEGTQHKLAQDLDSVRPKSLRSPSLWTKREKEMRIKYDKGRTGWHSKSSCGFRFISEGKSRFYAISLPCPRSSLSPDPPPLPSHVLFQRLCPLVLPKTCPIHSHLRV